MIPFHGYGEWPEPHGRFRGNVPAPGVRREPGGDAPRRGRARRRDRRPDADDPAGVAAGAAPPGPRLPLPGLQRPLHPGAPPPPLGAGRSDDALEPYAPLSPAPPRGPRGGLSRRAPARRRASVPAAGRPTTSRRAPAVTGARRSGPGP